MRSRFVEFLEENWPQDMGKKVEVFVWLNGARVSFQEAGNILNSRTIDLPERVPPLSTQPLPRIHSRQHFWGRSNGETSSSFRR